MKISVVLCTYNRCQSLDKTLESVAASILSAETEWEVLIVDNNSNDRTKDVVESFSSRYPGRFRYLFEPRQGKSFALNAGVRESLGNVLAFLDDDVTVEPTWLGILAAPLNGNEWAGTGGRTLLERPFSPPSWLAVDGPFSMGGVLAALFDLGDEPCELRRAPYGANMAYRKKMFEKYGLFRTDMGPGPNRNIPRQSEDTEFGRRLMAAGERLRYEPSAVAYHPILEGRVQKEYLLTWWFDFGRAAVRKQGRGAPIWGLPRHYLSIPKMVGTSLWANAPRWMRTLSP